MDDMVDVGCLMLATMTPKLQNQHEDMVAYEIIQNLKEINEGQARQERYETSKALFQCKMSEGSLVGAHVIKMMGYIQELEKLGFPLNDELAIDVILQSLPDSFNQFGLQMRRNLAKGDVDLRVGNGARVATLARRSTRERHEPERYGFFISTHGDVILVDQGEPKTYQEVVSSPDSEKWLEAMRSGIDSMSKNQVWTLVEPPEGVKPIGCKWVFKKNTDIGCKWVYNGQLVAKGFRKIHGVDYDETFSPIAMFKSNRILLAIAAFHDYEIWQMDVKTAFLNGKQEEDVYMTQPEGFVTPENVGKVCKLQRSIYGLK
ncbi:hypothetical protein GQ457_07G006660 [Hibiscus cannabinus]